MKLTITQLKFLSRLRTEKTVSALTTRQLTALCNLAKAQILRCKRESGVFDLAVECYNGNHSRDKWGNCIDCPNDCMFVHPGDPTTIMERSEGSRRDMWSEEK